MRCRILLLAVVLAIVATDARAQAWSAFLDPSRAIDWTSAGFTIPSYSTPCTTQPSLTAGLGAATTNTTSIVAALTSCDATHNAVNIPAGTWFVNKIAYPNHGKEVLRGAGPSLTTLIFQSTGGCAGGIGNQGICMADPNGTYAGNANVLPPSGSTQCLWTAGYAQGTTSITLSSCGGTPPLNKTIILDQANDTSDTNGVFICNQQVGTSCNNNGTGNADGRVIGGVIYSQQQVTFVTGVTSLGGGSYTVTISPGVYFTNVRSGQTPGAWWPGFVQLEGVENMTLSGINIAGTIAMGQCYQCWVKNVVSTFAGRNHIGVYMSGDDVIRDSYFYQAQTHSSSSYGVEVEESSQLLVENNIMHQTVAPVMFGQASGSVVSYNLGINNIYTGNEQVNVTSFTGTSGTLTFTNSGTNDLFAGELIQLFGFTAPNTGLNAQIVTVLAAGLTSTTFEAVVTGSGYSSGAGKAAGYPDATQTASSGHNSGNEMNLWEGNVMQGVWTDNVWGSSAQSTLYRNFLSGFQKLFRQDGTCFPILCESVPVIERANNRAMNVVGNVLGQPGVSVTYDIHATSSSTGTAGAEDTAIYSLGFATGGFGAGGACVVTVCDPLASSTMVRWDNYDTVNKVVRQNTTEGCPASVPFVTANCTNFSTPTTTLPASLYYNAKPSWWPAAKAWPPIGPDMATGNVSTCNGGTYASSQAMASGQCTGGTLNTVSSTTTAWASHVTSIPAQDCYLVTLNAPPDGSGGVLPFDVNNCLTVAAPVATFTPASTINFGQVPVGLTSNPITVTLQNTGTANLVVTSVTPSSAVFTLLNNTCGTSFTLTPTSSCTFQVTATPVSAVAFSGNVTFADNAGNPDVLSLASTGTGTPAPSVTPFAGALGAASMIPSVR
jgi:hypothetical protein